jgi:type IV secretory pathway TraG/TraD family ATPase VirD4
MIDTLRRLVGLDDRSYMLRVPRAEENEGLLLLGDPGTGKSQIIHQLLEQIADRRPPEAVVCYDPAGEFIESHFDPSADIVLNPLDARSPYWSPTMEVNYETTSTSATDRHLVAESFFPDREQGASTTQFFLKAARSIFARMLELKPTAERIVEVLKDEKLIDEIVAGTEHAHLINEGAKGQRGGVLATLSEIGEALKLLPSPDQCAGELSITEWARRRRGWIFITSSQDTRDALRTLHAAWINILMKRLLGVAPQWGRQHPCWVVVDEVHSLKRLPALSNTMVEGRKFGLKMVLGTQNKAQLEEHYGRGAATMLSAPHVKILFRCNEPESARWVAEMIGEEEKERPKIGTTATVQSNGRDSINYSTVTERRFVVSKEQIMALPNLRGYWKYSDSVVRFRIKPVDRPGVALAFMRRNPQSVTLAEEPAPPLVERPAERQLELPMPENALPIHSNELEDEDLEYSQEVSPEVPAGPQFNY